MEQELLALKAELGSLRRTINANAEIASSARGDVQGILIGRINGLAELLTTRIVDVATKADKLRKKDRDHLTERIDLICNKIGELHPDL